MVIPCKTEGRMILNADLSNAEAISVQQNRHYDVQICIFFSLKDKLLENGGNKTNLARQNPETDETWQSCHSCWRTYDQQEVDWVEERDGGLFFFRVLI